jgi:hypothetical protein
MPNTRSQTKRARELFVVEETDGILECVDSNSGDVAPVKKVKNKHVFPGGTIRTSGEIAGGYEVLDAGRSASDSDDDSDTDDDSGTDDDKMSDYESDEDRKRELGDHFVKESKKVFVGERYLGPTVLQATYKARFNRQSPINSSRGLSEANRGAQNGKQVNTIALYRESGREYGLYMQSNANGIRLYCSSFRKKSKDLTKAVGINVDNKEAVQVLDGNVHVEMYIIHHILAEKPGSVVTNCMRGGVLVVSQPICEQCYPYVWAAHPRIVRDGTSKAKSTKRGDYRATWTNPLAETVTMNETYKLNHQK